MGDSTISVADYNAALAKVKAYEAANRKADDTRAAEVKRLLARGSGQPTPYVSREDTLKRLVEDPRRDRQIRAATDEHIARREDMAAFDSEMKKYDLVERGAQTALEFLQSQRPGGGGVFRYYRPEYIQARMDANRAAKNPPVVYKQYPDGYTPSPKPQVSTDDLMALAGYGK